MEWYYQNGPKGASYIGSHETARTATRWGLTAALVPVKVIVYGGFFGFTLILISVVASIWISRGLGLKWRRAVLVGIGFAFVFIFGYSLVLDVPEAKAAYYNELGTYYYTVDHIGRPFNMRDGSTELEWWEHHYPFGEIISGVGSVSAGKGSEEIAWKPGFRFPGQYESDGMGITSTGGSFFVQNHYREYIPRLGRYNRVDPLYFINIKLPNKEHNERTYLYAKLNPTANYDFLGLAPEWAWGAAYTIFNNCYCCFRYHPPSAWTTYIWRETPPFSLYNTDKCANEPLCCSINPFNFPCCSCACELRFNEIKDTGDFHGSRWSPSYESLFCRAYVGDDLNDFEE